VPSKYVPVQGIATFLRHSGPTTLPEVPPRLDRGELILCLHHAGGNSGNFQAMRGALEAQHSSVSFDFPGHDRTASQMSLASVERMASFACEVLEALAPGRPVVLLGHGLGAAAARQCAQDAPALVRALGLCSAGAANASDHHQIERARQITQGKARREFDPSAFAKGVAPELMRAGFMDTLKTDPRVIHPNLVAYRDWRGGDRLIEVKQPCLVCIGNQEKPRVVEQAERLVAGLPNARKSVIEDAGHMLPLEKPVELAAAVTELLGELS
jgi:pimeloyl-ACP methyl ester carboxylesterase